LEIDVVKPRMWDLVAIGLFGIGFVIAAAGMGKALTSAAASQISSGAMIALAWVQAAICLGSLLILGKTAKEGTIWGNLAAVAGMFVGMSGVLLAAALWAAA
jgi:hypothetical protein